MPYQFTLPSSSGRDFDSAGHLPLVVYFYPKDSTPGLYHRGFGFQPPAAGVSGFGLYGGGYFARRREIAQNFCAKQGFQFELLSDKDEAVCKQFDVIN